MDKRLFSSFKRAASFSYWKELIAFFIILLAYIFVRSERKELMAIGPMLQQSDSLWIFIGLMLTGLFCVLQGLMYLASFQAIGLKISLIVAVELFLKRNFLSVFLPAGGISSLAYSTAQLRRMNLNKTQIHQAGVLYGYIGLLTVFIVALPVLIFSVWKQHEVTEAWTSLLILAVVLGAIYFLYCSFRHKIWLYQFIVQKYPQFVERIDPLLNTEVNKKQVGLVILYSILIECCGIYHVYISMYALGLAHSFEAALVTYTISVILMIVSPFLRGLGAVELSMLYVFKSYGYSQVDGLGITILYRVFEFWIPLLLGLLAFCWKGKQLITRLGPAILIFFLGLINICSVLTLPLMNRLKLEKLYFSELLINDFKLLVLLIGLGLLLTAAYLLKGYRVAYWFALIFCLLSIIGHLGKALDYEEAVIATVIMLFLWYNRKQYRIQASATWLKLGFTTFLVVFLCVCIFDVISFYFIDKRHFGFDFSWNQSIFYTAKCFLFFADKGLEPQTLFGKEFLSITKGLGIACWLLLIAVVFISRKYHSCQREIKELELAKEYIRQYGNSSLDYFKISADKDLFFSTLTPGFIAYRVAHNYAVVLDEPVCALNTKSEFVLEFEQYCFKQGLKTVYYRVEENSQIWFTGMKKQRLLMGQEAIVDLAKFSLEGKCKKSLRNGLNSLEKKGYVTEICLAPHQTEFIEELQTVSDEWLKAFNKKEKIFSQGMFDFEEIRNLDVICVRDGNRSVKGFLTIIPDFAMDECTYDLIRKTADAPGALMDGLIVKMIGYGIARNFKYLNLGLVAFSGLETANHTVEKILKYASIRINAFKSHQTQKDFKDKYAHRWENRYLIFDHDFDLLQLPKVLKKVMRPKKSNDTLPANRELVSKKNELSLS
ncbi:phosphatidylglycerol lysyltransferase domain-containing protein [Sphingobacterium sp. HJSM2_6]|uniref:phosphatidylglycerol lysyltransferase domain-containing protein n=1 Tax=Sphingobacterium sp. HJSM2_6 TaxID=3366264 RepID=UPI003BBAB148